MTLSPIQKREKGVGGRLVAGKMEAGPKKVDARVINARLAIGINAMRADVLAQIDGLVA